MRKCGFIFSLDAFVAFTLIMITINLLIFTIGTPKPYYPSLDQAQMLAFDTLQALASSSPTHEAPYYLEYAVTGTGPLSRSQVMNRVAGKIIPYGFGYRLQEYNFTSRSWDELYDSSSDPDSGRAGRNFTKLSASAMLFSSFYDVDPIRGESQYCYLTCKGYTGMSDSGPQYASNCSMTPCAPPTSGFLPGQNTARMVRLVVYT